jgi:hypothetical protein
MTRRKMIQLRTKEEERGSVCVCVCVCVCKAGQEGCCLCLVLKVDHSNSP